MIPTAQIWEDGLRTDPTKKSFEWWYFDAHLDDGSTVVIVFYTKAPSHAGGPLDPSIQVTVTKPDGKKLTFDPHFPTSEFNAKKEQCDVTIGTNTFVGDLKEYQIHLDLPEVKADLQLQRIAPSFSTSHKKDEKEYFGWFSAVPYGKVSGTVEYEGKTHHVSGEGYHDHNWGVLNLSDLCDYWYWGRGNAGDYYIIYTVMYLPKILGGKQASVFYLAKKDQILIESSNQLKVSQIDIDPPTPHAGHLPKTITFELTEGDNQVEFTVMNKERIEYSNPLRGQPKWRQFLTKLFSHPLYVRFNAELSMHVKVKNINEQTEGKTLYEIMILH